MKNLGGNVLGKNLLKYFNIDYDKHYENGFFPLAIGLKFNDGILKKYKWVPFNSPSASSINESALESGAKDFVDRFQTGKATVNNRKV